MLKTGVGVAALGSPIVTMAVWADQPVGRRDPALVRLSAAA
jgi:hypothetical protein